MKKSIIVGMGKTGISCARYLARKNKHFIVFDTRLDPPELNQFRQEFPKVPVYLQDLEPNLIQQAEEIIVSPGVALDMSVLEQARQNRIPIIGDVELFARAAQAPIVAITGTNAKGTVTTLVGEMIKQAGLEVIVGGNIGVPVLDLLTKPTPDFYVLELSSFQLESTFSLTAAATTILNISEDHLDRHKTMAAYIQAKQRIYQNCKFAVWNRDDKWTYPAVRDLPSYNFGLSEPKAEEFGIKNKQNENWLAFDHQDLLPVSDLLIKGKHNWANALAALALGKAIGLDFQPMVKALQAFKGLEHRCEWLGIKNNIAWYNDSKGTNIGATIAALEGLGEDNNGKLVLIAGGIGKGANFSILKPAVAKYVRTVILFGQDAELIAKALDKTVPIQHVKDMPEAITVANKSAQSGDAVLLSPACASFDMFNNYEHRGDVFKTLVRDLIL